MAQTQYLDKAGLEVLVTNIKNADKAILDKIGTIPAKVGETDTTTVIAYVEAKAAAAVAAASADNTAMDTRMDAVETAVETLTGADTVAGSIAKAVKDEADRAKGIEGGLQDAIDALEGLVGDTAVATQISNAITTATGADSQLAKDVAANKAAITTLNGTGAGSVSKAVDDLRKEIMEGEGVDPDVVESFKELQEYIESHGTEAASMAADILALQNAGGQPNVIETVKKNGVALTVTDKAVDITIASTDVTDFATAVAAVKVSNTDEADHAASADEATKATQDGDGNVISNTYVKTADIASIPTTDIDKLFE